MPSNTIRNVALVGHAGSGKSSLAEAMLMAMGAIPPGDPTQGPTHSDYDSEEHKRHASLQTSLLTGRWRDHKINLVDTPGLSDFIIDARYALRAVDAVVLLVDGVKGLEVNSQRLWQEARQLGLPVMLVVSKLDMDKASIAQALDSAREPLGVTPWPLTLPAGPDRIARLLDQQSQTAYGDPQAWGSGDDWADARTSALEAATELDDALLARYLDGEALPAEVIKQAWRQGLLTGKLVPAFATSAKTGMGINALLDAVVDLAPTPAEHPPLTCLDPTSGESWTVDFAQEKMLCAWVFKTLHDPYAGKISLFRVYSGQLHADEPAYNPNRTHAERFGRLFTLVGKQHVPVDTLESGDIGAVAKLRDTQTGDTLLPPAMEAKPFVLAPVARARSLYAVALIPHAKGDDSKLATVLAKLRESDPALSVAVEASTHRSVLAGMGQTHLDVILARLASAGVNVATTPPQIPYRETITQVAQAQGKHKKQTGGHGQYGDVWLRLEPLPEGSGYAFASEVVGGVVPKPLIPAVDKGIQEVMEHGPLIGAPVVDFRAVVYDGSHHSVDSSEMSFKLAAHLAFKKAFQAARPILLEPSLQLTITVPEAATGDVISDLTTRRGRVLGIETMGHWQVVRASAPMSEVVEYSNTLTSLTRGAGSYTAEFARYEPVPQAVSDRLIAAHQEHAAK